MRGRIARRALRGPCASRGMRDCESWLVLGDTRWVWEDLLPSKTASWSVCEWKTGLKSISILAFRLVLHPAFRDEFAGVPEVEGVAEDGPLVD